MVDALVVSATPPLPIRAFNHRREGDGLEQVPEGLVTHPTESCCQDQDESMKALASLHLQAGVIDDDVLLTDRCSWCLL